MSKPTHLEILSENGTTFIVPKKDITLSQGSEGNFVKYGDLENEYFYISKETYEEVKQKLLREVY